MSSVSPGGLGRFISVVESRIDELTREADFDASQRELLLETVAAYRPKLAKNPLCNPLALFYLVARAQQKQIDEQAIALAAFCQLYVLSLDVFDDVQDNDLCGKPYEKVGPPIATNAAIALMFLSLRALSRGLEFEQDHGRQMAYLRLFNEVSLLAAAGQHRDLLGEDGVKSPRDVLAMQQAKTSSTVLVCECAAIFAHCNHRDRLRYRRIGENLALIVQIIGDMRDVYGKKVSPDLATGKMTYPVACFLEKACPEALGRFEQLKTELPTSLPALRRLFYESGAVGKVASSLEAFRRDIIDELAATQNHSPSHRTLVFLIDGLVSTIYRAPVVSSALPLIQPEGVWHSRVRHLASEFAQRMQGLGMPSPPPLIPWHLPQWLYDPDRGVVYYPDIEGQPEETLPFQADVLGTDDLSVAQAALEATAPAVIAHELVHFWRHSTGNLTSDKWHEELVANTVALSYCAEFDRPALDSALELAHCVLHRLENPTSPVADAILGRLFSAESNGIRRSDYGVSPFEMALIHFRMLLRLGDAVLPVRAAVERYLPQLDGKAA